MTFENNISLTKIEKAKKFNNFFNNKAVFVKSKSSVQNISGSKFIKTELIYLVGCQN